MKRRKVLLVLNNFLVGGVERLWLDIITHLDRGKIDIRVATILGGGPLEEQFQRAGIKLYFVGPRLLFTRRLPFKLYWLLLAPLTLLRLIFLIIRLQPEVVITSLYQADVIGILAAWLTSVKKRVVVQHDVQRLGPLRQFVKSSLALRLTTHVVANSHTVKQFLMHYFQVPGSKITVIPNGVDLRLFSQGVRLPDDVGELVLGMIGRLEPVKGPFYLLEALKILREDFQLEPRTIFFGDGSLRVELENYAKRHHLKNVQFAGFVLNVPEALRKIDILVVPSLAEGFGLVVLEGLAAHKVLVASDLPAIRELVDARGGILFKAQDSRALALALRNIFTDAALLGHLREGALQWLEERGSNFDIQTVASSYRAFLAQLD